MKKRSKWLLVGSLMCIGVGSVFHHGYGMFNDNKLVVDETSWEQKAVEADASQVELEKVENGFFTYKQIVIGYKYWNKFEKIKDLNDVTNEEKLELLIHTADNGNEDAIEYLLVAYLLGWYGLKPNDPKGVEFAKEYANKGSEVAIKYLLKAYKEGWYGLQANKLEAIRLAEYYAGK